MATHPTKHRGGQRRKYVQGIDGKEVTGLSRHRPTGRYYALTEDKKRVYFGRDLAEAVYRFRRWEAEQGEQPLAGMFGQPIQQLRIDDLRPDERERVKASTKKGKAFYRRAGLVSWSEVRSMLLSDPAELERKTGLKVKVITAPDRSPTLKRIGELYEQRDDIGDEQKRKCRDHWDLFVSAVKPARTVADVSADQVKAFRDALKKGKLKPRTARKGKPSHRVNKGKPSPRTIKNIFDNIRAVLIHAQAEESSGELSQLIDYCKMLKPPRGRKQDPEIISPEDFEALLKAADTLDTAWLLLSLNCALTPVELARIDQADIDLKKRTFVGRREKTGRVVRAAILWPRTVSAVEAWLKDRPAYTDPQDKSKPLLTTKHGRLSEWTIRERFRDLRKAAGVSDEVKLFHARKSAATAADEAGADERNGFDDRQVSVLLGHSHGTRDEYVRRNPGPRVAKASQAVEDHYFPSKTKRQK